MQKSHGRIHVEIPLVFRPNPQISTASHPSNLLGRERRGASGSLPLTSDESRCNFQDGIDRNKYIYIYYNMPYDYIDLIVICLCVCAVCASMIYVCIYIYIHIYTYIQCGSLQLMEDHCSSLQFDKWSPIFPYMFHVSICFQGISNIFFWRCYSPEMGKHQVRILLDPQACVRICL